jgi:signal transduction histidine kinase
MRLSYAKIITRNCAGSAGGITDVPYWRNSLFAGTIIYLLPFCIVALVPGIYYCLVTQQYIILVTDVLCAVGMLVLAFVPGIAIHTRKLIFIGCLYLLSCILIYYVGLYGPGLVYLEAACLFAILLFADKYSWWPPILNTLICILFSVAIRLGLLPWPHIQESTVESWIVVCSNLVFLGFLFAALLPRLFKGMEATMAKEKLLLQQVSKEQHSLELTLKMLEQKSREMEQFAYIASHDLQEPLRMVSIFLKRLEKKYAHSLDEAGRQYIHFAVDGAQRMQQMIVNLLEFSRIGKTHENLEEVDLQVLVNEVLNIFRQQIVETSATIEVGQLPIIQTYRTPMKQVFQNLVSNALKYRKLGTATPPRILINASLVKNQWLFAVTDNGIGINARDFERIFIIFQRLHSSTEYPGTGIGLAIIRKIVESVGGRIWVESEPGRGSSFYFTVPQH